jgi:hypothetical protein
LCNGLLGIHTLCGILQIHDYESRIFEYVDQLRQAITTAVVAKTRTAAAAAAANSPEEKGSYGKASSRCMEHNEKEEEKEKEAGKAGDIRYSAEELGLMHWFHDDASGYFHMQPGSALLQYGTYHGCSGSVLIIVAIKPLLLYHLFFAARFVVWGI